MKFLKILGEMIAWNNFEVVFLHYKIMQRF